MPFHSALKSTPFWIVYRRDSPRLLSYAAWSEQVAALDQALHERDLVLKDIQVKLEQAQAWMKTYNDKGRRDWCNYI